MVSRTHPGLIRQSVRAEVPEIADDVVELKDLAREPGHRTKIAVWSNDHNVDPVGACVSARGGRVRMVVNELRGENVDIVAFSEDPSEFVLGASSALGREVRGALPAHRRRRVPQPAHRSPPSRTASGSWDRNRPVPATATASAAPEAIVMASRVMDQCRRRTGHQPQAPDVGGGSSPPPRPFRRMCSA